MVGRSMAINAETLMMMGRKNMIKLGV